MSHGQTRVAARPRVQSIRPLTSGTYVLRFERNGMEFTPGQYVSVGVAGDIDMREYSIYSSPADDFLEIIVKEVDSGHVSRRLRRLRPGDEVTADGPFGFFTIPDEIREAGRLLFIATGTGISPFHCFARAYPGLDYTLLHGVRTLEERYEHEVFEPARVVTCVSRETLAGPGDPGASTPGLASPGHAALFGGRVTDYLRSHRIDPETNCYLCGNCDMIYESFDILKGQGLPPEHLYAEVYF
jgi:ferredoxin--NADP+ reductase/benzoate/toluate 1,2-dioxygenase reductase subunit